jgi:Leucine-rich repeat (LRR) protein
MRISTVFLHLFICLMFLASGAAAQGKQSSQPKGNKKTTPATQQHKQVPKSKPGTHEASTKVIKFTPEQIESFKQQSIQLVKFFEGTLNFLADKKNPVKEKQVIINQSYDKIFWDSKVQVEDDLDEKRLVTLYKDVQGYLSDVDFFFRRATFLYTVQDVAVMTNDIGQTYFKVTTNRNLAGVTINDDSTNTNKVRYFEINYDDSKEQLKIVSIYTTKYDEREEMRVWWNNLSQAWKDVFGKKILIDSTLTLNQVATYHDSTAVINGIDTKLENVKFYKPLTQVVNLTHLDMSGNKEISDLGPLIRLSSLTDVNISNTSVTDLMPLRNLNLLESLDISGTRVTSLDALRYANNIKTLKIKGTAIETLDLVANFPLMEVLDFSNTTIGDLTPIKDLTGIRDLRLSGTRVTDLKPISGLVNLEILYCADDPITDISVLSSMNKLQLVFLDNTKITSLTPLENLQSLRKVYCDGTTVPRNDAIQFMKKNPSVTVIFESEELKKWWAAMPADWKKFFANYLHNGEASTPEELHRLTTIDSINVRGRLSINTLDPISEFNHLRFLDCSSTAVTSLEPLRHLTEIKIINIANTKVASLEPLSSLKSIEILTADNTSVSDLAPLKEDAAMQFIFADNTQIKLDEANNFMDVLPGCLVVSQTYDNANWWKNLSPQWKDVFLKQAGISGEPDKIQLQKISGLEALVVAEDPMILSLQPVLHLSRLKEIQFTDTRISTLEPLEQMKTVVSVHCMKNPISSLEPLAGMTWLKELDFSNTQVDELIPLQNLRNLEVLKFSGTPVKSLKYLQNLLHLKTLEFYNTRVSSLDVLEPMSGLKSLKIFNTKVSEKKVEKFKSTHPACEVVYY